MFCPQCGTESKPGQQYCRSCGANLKFIGKAVSLSEAIARSDRGPLPKIKEIMQGFGAEHVTEEVSRALDQMNKEIVVSFSQGSPARPEASQAKVKETPEQRRENHIVKGTASFFGGVALMIFLYFFSATLVLKIPPEAAAKIPFEIEPAARMIWLIGLIPALSGLGRATAGLLMGSERGTKAVGDGGRAGRAAASVAEGSEPGGLPGTVTEGTTELLEHKVTKLNRTTW